ncbi:hypothetical protein BO70DRAFT_6647 [Aspergillus heteromorphus CBS 117.55]|uniref:Uncharacterized protein n=1 Tax=Aspergillus heteromorphus CBS 117.55 TaxID=1448321 RepID=A0A317X0T6_9EURO|nr:uncharacterized protein BO70DRAFT_6647 [Aspergillus heteromorphus CBS 117.55]PWY92264.1 hypothetical protein BO70DRAFT_6647 [Aspergillus heteromorphus CBS 117.55]
MQGPAYSCFSILFVGCVNVFLLMLLLLLPSVESSTVHYSSNKGTDRPNRPHQTERRGQTKKD